MRFLRIRQWRFQQLLLNLWEKLLFPIVLGGVVPQLQGSTRLDMEVADAPERFVHKGNRRCQLTEH